ncbi:MAG: hypothetical protein KDC38_12995 [Planctomycetes bacterium]|nr:hypothetical protein [Planctomycetota bacterium]
MSREVEMVGGLKVRHVYEHDPADFERSVNVALGEILDAGHTLVDLHYSVDPASHENRRGGFGALILFEVGVHPDEGSTG